MLRLPSLGEIDRGVRVRIWLRVGPTDMRKGFDTLAAVVREFLAGDGDSHLFRKQLGGFTSQVQGDGETRGHRHRASIG